MHYAETDGQHSHSSRTLFSTLAKRRRIKHSVGLGVRGAVPGNLKSQQRHWVTELQHKGSGELIVQEYSFSFLAHRETL